MKIFALVAALMFATLATGCGTKGPLYLPKKGTATPAQPAALPDPLNPSIPAPETTSEKPTN